MMKPEEILTLIAAARGTAICVPTMTTGPAWRKIAPDDLSVGCVGFMGGASAMGLGLALGAPDRRVIVFDGDGSLLMNLGGLTTLARYRPGNLVHVVFDNESLLSVGGFPTATSTGSDLAAIAKGAGVPRTATVRSLEEFRDAFLDARNGHELTTLVAKVEAVGPAGYVTDLSLLENRYQFARCLKDFTQKG